MRRILFYFNFAATVACIVVALTKNDTSLLFYLALGFFQVITTLLTTYASISEKQNSSLFGIYWVMVFIFFLLLRLGAVKFESSLFMILPMLIALYNCFVHYKFSKLKI